MTGCDRNSRRAAAARHSIWRRQRPVPRAPRRAFGDRPLIGRQGLRHALALLCSILFGPEYELLLLRGLLPLPHGVIMPYARLQA